MLACLYGQVLAWLHGQVLQNILWGKCPELAITVLFTEEKVTSGHDKTGDEKVIEQDLVFSVKLLLKFGPYWEIWF